MNINDVKKLESMVRQLESSHKELSLKTQMKKHLDEAKFFEVRVVIDGYNSVCMNDIPKEIVNTLLDSYYEYLETKKREATQILVYAGVSLDGIR